MLRTQENTSVELFTLAHEASGNVVNTSIYCNVAKGICRKEPTMVKIKISYETPDELEEVLRLLHPVTSSYKVAKCQNGAYRRAYVEVAINRQQNGEEVKKY